MNNESVWDKHYGRDRARQHYPDENVVRVLKKLYAAPSVGGVALDLGSGSGRHLPLLSEHFSEVCAADFSAASLQLLPSGLAAVTQLTLPQMPFNDARFDFILCWGVLHYLEAEKVPEAIAQIWRVLKPGAQIFLTLRSDADTHLKEQLRAGDLQSGHANLYSRAQATALFSAFSQIEYGFISRQPLGEVYLVAHHMILARK